MKNTLKLKGIILNESDLDQVRLAGFYNFREYDGQMDYRDDRKFQEWQITKLEHLDTLTAEYMYGQDDAKFFVFSNKPNAQQSIKNVFPKLEFVEVNHEDYPFDYDYMRDNKPL